MRPRPNLDGVERSGPARGWCAAARKPTLTTEWDSLYELAHRARGKITMISSDSGVCPPWARRTHWFARSPMGYAESCGRLRARPALVAFVAGFPSA
jgi:hypothetical protein